MNKVNKYSKTIYFIVVISIIISTIAMDIPFLFKQYVQNRYPMTEISNEQFLEKSENLKDFENNNGRLHSLSSYPWVLYNSKEVNFDDITQIKINVSYLSSNALPSEIYVRDLDRCIKFEIKEGENIINIPKDINDGNPIKGFRFNLINKDNEEIEIKNIVFNDTDSIIRNLFIKNYKEQISKIMLFLILCITPILLFKLGLKKASLNKFGIVGLTCSLIAIELLYKFNIINITYFVFLAISIILAGILVYYLMTKTLLQLYTRFSTRIKNGVQVFLTIIFIICCFTIYLNVKILFIYMAFYPFYLFGFIYDRFKVIQCKSCIVNKIIIILSIIILLKFIFDINNISMLWEQYDTSNIKLSIIAMIIMSWLIGFGILAIENIRNKIQLIEISKINNVYVFITIFICSMVKYTEVYGYIYMLTFLLITVALQRNISLIEYQVNKNESEEKYSLENMFLDKEIISIFKDIVVIVFTTVFFESFIEYLLNRSSIHIFILNYIFTTKCLYNLILFAIIYYLFRFLFGNGLGKILLSFIGSVILVGNYIKIRYQNTLLKPADFFQIKSLFEISKNFLSIHIILLIAVIILIIIFLIIRFRNYIISILKLSPNIIMFILLGISLAFFNYCLEQGKFKDVQITKEMEWLGDNTRINNEGFFIYNYFNIKGINEIKISKPKDYDEQTIENLKNEFQTLYNNKNTNDIKPNVILIMEESMFDIQKIDELKFNKTIDLNIKKYQKGTTISPRYGGGTASVEFEALTGFSNIFFPDNIIQYITYWNRNDNIPSLAKEFNKNGYTTTAIHPNDANYYNRDQVYTAMGFNKFLTIEDFKNHMARSTRGFILDSQVNEVIKEQLNSTNDPQFIFAVTIENHGLYNSKDLGNDITISSDKLSDSQKYEAESYAGGLADADSFIGDVIENVKNSSKPTIVYVWGDHLPALSALEELGFMKDVYNIYSTPLIAYSNFKDINIGAEYITPNQLAPQVLKDSGINYSNYFDYIYDLRNKYPIIHKDFGINTEDEMIRKYELLQYDLLFGDKYILK